MRGNPQDEKGNLGRFSSFMHPPSWNGRVPYHQIMSWICSPQSNYSGALTHPATPSHWLVIPINWFPWEISLLYQDRPVQGGNFSSRTPNAWKCLKIGPGRPSTPQTCPVQGGGGFSKGDFSRKSVGDFPLLCWLTRAHPGVSCEGRFPIGVVGASISKNTFFSVSGILWK